MTDREPDAEELAKASEEAEVEGHSIEEDEEGEAAVLDINFGCHEAL
ncbi:MAG TPA: hypothetical protein VFI65_10460 [Streptosporangiaceae bacterium]|jgi:phosphoenolpyruvate carboxylase|nr:hypothetical protein [Streptosporangiaceae bacterium]HXS65533.1 hypothetical protein [Streptosporangiaceae bacterium]